MTLAAALRRLLAEGGAGVLVEIDAVRGSAPREQGAAMLVAAHRCWGTIGGGQLEFLAIGRARAGLDAGELPCQESVTLGPAIGQCCGGVVDLRFSLAGQGSLAVLEAREAADQARWPLVLVFGAGHVGQALIKALEPLPFRLRWIDPRPEVWRQAEVPARVALAGAVLNAMDTAEAGAAAVVLTHSHALDALLVEAALRRGDLAYVGVIGSAAKRAQFARALRDAGIERLDRLVCPIGGRRVRDKKPAVIAAMVAAELLECFAG